MQREELKEYLRNVSVLERQVYVYQNSKMEYTRKINELEQIPYVQTYTEEQKAEWKKTEGYKQFMEARRKRYNKKFWLQRLLKGIVWAAYFAGSLYMGIEACWLWSSCMNIWIREDVQSLKALTGHITYMNRNCAKT